MFQHLPLVSSVLSNFSVSALIGNVGPSVNMIGLSLTHVLKMEELLILTHLSQMKCPTDITLTSPFPIFGLLGGIFHFYSKFKRNFCLQTVEKLIRRHLPHLIWFCTVCICPTKRTLGYMV